MTTSLPVQVIDKKNKNSCDHIKPSCTREHNMSASTRLQVIPIQAMCHFYGMSTNLVPTALKFDMDSPI